MGGKISKLLGKGSRDEGLKILMLGLFSAGKTAILCKLVYDYPITTIPTISFNVENLVYNNVKFRFCDVGDQYKTRPLWRHYYPGTQGLIFVVDSQDRDQIDEAKEELHRVLEDSEMKDCILLVFANKQDLPNAMSPEEVTEKLELHRLQDRNWSVLPSCAITGEGLFEGLAWLNQNIKPQ